MDKMVNSKGTGKIVTGAIGIISGVFSFMHGYYLYDMISMRQGKPWIIFGVLAVIIGIILGAIGLAKLMASQINEKNILVTVANTENEQPKEAKEIIKIRCKAVNLQTTKVQSFVVTVVSHDHP